MESELHTAAIDTELYEEEKAETQIDDYKDEKAAEIQNLQSIDEVDTVIMVGDETEALPSAPEVNDLERSVEETIASISAMDIESAPSAPVLDDIPRSIPSKYYSFCTNKNHTYVKLYICSTSSITATQAQNFRICTFGLLPRKNNEQ